MNRFTSCLALAATTSILGCKTTGGSETVLPAPTPRFAEVTRFKPEVARPLPVVPGAADAINPPAPPSELQPRIAPIMLRNDMSERPAQKVSAGQRLGGTLPGRTVSASTPVQELVGILTALEAIPHSIVAILGSAKVRRTETDTRRDTTGAPPATTEYEERAAGTGIWTLSWVTPFLTGLCAYIIAPLLVDLLKQRIQLARREQAA